MNTEKQSVGGHKVADSKGSGEIPDLQLVRKWVASDLRAAHYFLGLLIKYPEVMDKAADEMYAYILEKEKVGARVDSVEAEVNRKKLGLEDVVIQSNKYAD